MKMALALLLAALIVYTLLVEVAPVVKKFFRKAVKVNRQLVFAYSTPLPRMNLQLFATAANQTVHAGHTILIKIDGQEVGRIQSGDGRRSFGQEGVYQIGSIMPQEHVPLRYEGGFTIDKFYVRKKDLAKLGLAALGEDILTMDVIDIEVLDNITGETVRLYEGCSLNDYSESFRVGAIAGENASWVYLKAS